LKTEKQKMLDGELYLASDAELTELRRRARRLTRVFNATTEEETALRLDTLRELLGSIGTNCEIETPFRCDYGAFLSLGHNVFINFGCVILDCNYVEIGDHVLIGPNVGIYAATHPVDPAERMTLRELGKPIRIGRNVWIGGNSVICPGVSIGENTTIGAGSIVTKDIPANVVAAGNPCKVLREITSGPHVDS
jgi:maltose O-acetyltransferase